MKKLFLTLAVLSLLIIKTPAIPSYQVSNETNPSIKDIVYSITPLPQDTHCNTSLLSSN